MPRFWNRLVDSLPRESKNLIWRAPLVLVVLVLSLLIFLPFRDTPYAIRVVNETYGEKGRVQQELREVVPYGTPVLAASDILDWPAFAARLKEQGAANTPSPGARIWGLMLPEARAAVGEIAAGKDLTDARKAEIVGALNDALKLPDFYNEKDFEGIALKPEAQKLLALDRKSLTKAQVERLNRLLLNAAYPVVLARVPRTHITDWWVWFTKPFHYEIERELSAKDLPPKEGRPRKERLLEVLSRGLNLGLDLRGGTELLYSIRPIAAPKKAGTTKARAAVAENVDAETVKQIIQRRIDAYGLRETRIQAQGDKDILVQLPGQEPAALETIKRIIKESGRLEFRIVAPKTSEAYKEWKNTGKAPAGYMEYPLRSLKDDRYVEEKTLVSDKLEMTGEYISTTRVITSGSTSSLGPSIGLSFTPRGEHEFARVTGDNVGERMAIILNTQRAGGEIVDPGTCYSAPVIRTKIYGDAVIEGDFTLAEANALRTVLMAGSLPVPLRLESETTVGPSLGPVLISKGTFAVAVGLIAVIGFMAIYYLLGGVIADFAVFLNVLIIVSVMILFDATLTMPGIAGLLLTVGMSVDANVLIFERIREEQASSAEKPLRLSVRDGYGRAFWTIFDSNVTTLLTAVILYWIGTGPVKGFAVVLSIGIIASMFTAIVGTRVVFDILTWRHVISRLSMLQLFKRTHIRFMAMRNKFLLASGTAIAVGMTVFFIRGNENWDIDFRGGTLLHVVFQKAVDADEIVRRLHASGPEFAGAEVQSIRSAAESGARFVGRHSSEFEIRVPTLSEATIADVKTTPAATPGTLPATVRLYAPKTAKELDQAFANAKIPGYEVRAAGTPNAQGETDTFDITAPLIDAAAARADLEKAFAAFKPADQKSALAGFTPGKPSVNYRAEATVEIDRTVPVPEIEKALDATGGYWQVEPQPRKPGETGPQVLLIRSSIGNDADVREHIDKAFSTESLASKVREIFKGELDTKDPIPRIAKVGPAVAFQMLVWALVAITASCLMIIAYVWLRFERFKYGVAAVVALVHDVLITTGFLAILQVKFNLAIVAALLTIVGYSINDTIVVFDRIRENLRRERRRDVDTDLIDTSVNQTLSRTTLTSLTTFVAVLSLFLFAGGVIHDFAVALLIGITVGTYSSIFIASPLLVLHQEQIERRLTRRNAASA